MNTPDQFSYHEVTDRISLIQDILESAVIEHPVTLAHSSFRARAIGIQESLSELLSYAFSLQQL